jgi:bifunctional non-homologous end joining protein LigD
VHRDRLTLAEPPGEVVPDRRRRVRPMLPAHGDGPFDDPEYLFEPWWPGARIVVFVAHGGVRVQAAELADLLAVFPELHELGRCVADDAVLDGVLMVLDASARPDLHLLRDRIVTETRCAGRAAFVATDLLRLGDRSVAARRFAERRILLNGILPSSDWCAVSRGISGEGHTMASAAAAMGFDALSAHRLDGRYQQGQSGEEWLRLPVVSRGPRLQLPPLLTVLTRLPL